MSNLKAYMVGTNSLAYFNSMAHKLCNILASIKKCEDIGDTYSNCGLDPETLE
jgi:hypothetical protein